MLRSLLIIALTALPVAPAAAFTQGDVVRGEVLPGWRMADGHHMAALSITLAPGWKTYWRSPGDAGIPPVFDVQGSGNLAAFRLHWPSPVAFDLNGMKTVGYHDRVIVPIEVTPARAGKPIDLRLGVELGVCRDICVPAQLDLAITLPAEGAPDAAIRAALAAGPIDARAAGMSAITCAVAPISDGLQITTEITMPARGPREMVVIEPADTTIWVSQSETRRKGGTLVAVTDLVASAGMPFALDRAGLRVTVLGGGGSVEVTGCPAP